MGRTTRRVILELHDDGGLPEGVAYREGGARRPFAGWLGLICALDALVHAGGPHAHRNEMEDEDVDDPTHRA
jgi:hypothetical protein